MLREQERSLLRALVKEGTITRDTLDYHGYIPSEIEDAFDNLSPFTIYDNAGQDVMNRCKKLVSKVLGQNWKDIYGYTESHYFSVNGHDNTFGLTIWLTKEKYDQILAENQKALEHVFNEALEDKGAHN